ncbi:MAG: L-seryl-tRNA(Sec) selenium transferase [Acidobacteria bacterium]|nr:MAG: L-seryl-tRNA(Sec) selenium transferase [Acidobacteriota bacterium]
MSASSSADLRRRLPSVDQVLQDPRFSGLVERHGRGVVLRVLRRLLDTARERAASGDEAGLQEALDRLGGDLADRVERGRRPSLVRVLNATGVVVHTNLGRAPLSPVAAARVAEIASSYSNLEYDLAVGERGDREAHAEARLRDLLGAEGTVVVNNCAAAVLLALNTLAEGREVLVSRGELVEIGGSFRIPEILRKSGARLREVGTTNRTRLADYRAAMGPETAVILRVHPSNFRIVGFTEAPDLAELAELARSAGVPLVEDQGSGLLEPLPEPAHAEPTVSGSLRGGADLVTFSGDKLLGGPQAGLVAGRRGAIEAMRRNPLYRALRVDKMTLAALDAVLLDHEADAAAARVPVRRMLALGAEAVRARARALADVLANGAPSLAISVQDGESAVGGGAVPTVGLPTALLALTHSSAGPDRLAAALRAGEPPVIVRVAEDRVLVDLRTVEPADEPALLLALRAAAERAARG